MKLFFLVVLLCLVQGSLAGTRGRRRVGVRVGGGGGGRGGGGSRWPEILIDVLGQVQFNPMAIVTGGAQQVHPSQLGYPMGVHPQNIQLMQQQGGYPMNPPMQPG
ncbi:unnamed protein product [Bursaphelenchus xylophilus]|uniref:(pine wood nematode) hypothetical protein n=1 Tax=Bursaphelenchus xylophilus TaxID=6326 RepID=A0A1I7RLD6_BURXY|nr:unnamed protein product [Bursaphelenchus xylophilus]CAG9083118.1 unnamed protein product [Bursaphelenchus xylophilus]